MESWEDKKSRIFGRDGYRCRRCQTQTGQLSLHHIIPRELFGSDEDDNLITLCNDCHNWVELNLAFEPFLRTRTGIINSTPTVQYKIIPAQYLGAGYPSEGDKRDIWSLWIKNNRKGAKELIERYAAKVIKEKHITYTPKLLKTGSVKTKVKVKSTMTADEYKNLFK